jgi:hypothetical protein
MKDHAELIFEVRTKPVLACEVNVLFMNFQQKWILDNILS